MLVANEWLEMLTMRYTSIHFNLIWLGFFLVYLGLENNSSSQPKLDEYPKTIEHNIYLRLANDVWWWLILSLAQFIFNWGIYDRFIAESQSQKFLDLCAIAKISVFIQDSHFHAFYLHGDSNYDRADSTMARLATALLEKVGCHAVFTTEFPQVQCFECFYSPPFKQAFDSIRTKYTSSAQKRRRMRLNTHPQEFSNDFLTGERDHDPLLMQRDSEKKQILDTISYLEQSQTFIKHFLTHQYRDPYALDWDVHDPNLYDRFIGTIPQLPQNGTNCLFTTDRLWLFGLDHSFLNATFLGHDLDFLILEILTFLTVDLLFLDAATAIFFTFILHHGLRLFRTTILGAGGFLDDHMLLIGRLASSS